ncbi:hypothetical protein A7K91_02345 [Paenibacillus oryzae]|uniref:Acyltransferase 3 domain-containing protein n=1 Tax=Paenibacillus oryzae TaxID=1844972 RepID=A0A1A5YA77_9BACL|nr:acyltransferase family protein [Paenibacillus oryzae]OBR62473.1 hypothetical protein A7K91_02345 [Paenibacillus oryzae]
MKRLNELDNLKVFLTALVIIFHAAIAYGAAGSWILKDSNQDEMSITAVFLTLFTAVCQTFFMGLFFFISAYFSSVSLSRKGSSTFIKDRLLRLGIPMLVYYFLIGPITVWFAHYRLQLTLAEFYNQYVWSFERTFFGPAWFLQASIYFAVIHVFFEIVLKKMKKAAPRFSFPKGAQLLWLAVGMGLAAFVTRLIYPTGEGPLELQLGYFPSYIVLYIAGIIAQKNGWLDNIPPKLQKGWQWLSLGLIPVLPVILVLTGALDGEVHFEGGVNAEAFLYAIWEPFVCIGIILTLLSLFRRRFYSTSPLKQWLSRHAYAVYLIHPAVVVGWTMAFQGLPLPSAVKWAVVSILSIVCCFMVASILKMLPFAKRVL